ncbi:hypothetical protein [Streptomyces sp. CA-251251]
MCTVDGEQTDASFPALPGGIGVSRPRVYDVEDAHGEAGGTPHVHLARAEGYDVLSGSGAVQTLGVASGFATTPLRPGTLVGFDPGTIHRLVDGGGLEILVIMSNSGLPEAGDAVLTLPPRRP